MYNFQNDVEKWMLKCFGTSISCDKIERNYRFLEEAIELVQSCNCTKKEAHELVDYVFNRKAGDKFQEVGGVLITLSALCSAQDLEMNSASIIELKRCWDNIENIRSKQKNKPKNSPLTQG